MNIFDSKLQAYVVGMVSGQRTLIALAPRPHINLKRHWDSPEAMLAGAPPDSVKLLIEGYVTAQMVWEDGANPEDLLNPLELDELQPQLEMPAPEIEAI